MVRTGFLLLAALFLMFPASLHAQDQGAAARLGDSTRSIVLSGTVDSTGSAVQHKSAGTAMLLSAILPGAGQFYNQSYWKVPVIAGIGGYFISQWIINNNRYHDYRDQYRASLLIDPQSTLAATQLRLREFYKDQRDNFAWYFLVLYLINLADAYVDASLFDFNVGSDLSLQTLPGVPRPLTLTLHLHL